MVVMPEGDCFRAAPYAAIEIAQDRGPTREDWTEVLVAHGLPIGRGPENGGRRFWHAWTEVRTSAGWIVVDASNDRLVVVKRAKYYRAGRITDPETQVWRYGYDEVRAHTLSFGTWGPWVEGWESMEDIDPEVAVRYRP